MSDAEAGSPEEGDSEGVAPGLDYAQASLARRAPVEGILFSHRVVPEP